MIYSLGTRLLVVPDDFAMDASGPFAVIEVSEATSRTMKKRLNQLRYNKAKISVTTPGANPRRQAFLVWGIALSEALSLGAEAALQTILWIEDGLIVSTNCADGSREAMEGWAANFVREDEFPSNCIYVIRLSADVLESKDFLEVNPKARTAKDLFYVGRTSRSWEERFDQHRRGHKASRFVRKHGVELVRELCVGYMPLKVAEDREVEYAAELRTAGYAVWQN